MIIAVAMNDHREVFRSLFRDAAHPWLMPGDAEYPGAPVWVKALALVALAAGLVVAALLLTGHGPAMHGPPSGGHSP